MVVFSHCYPALHGSDATEPLYRATGGLFTLGSIALAFFFIASGFAVSESWARDPSLTRYVQKRALRIFPGYLASVAFCVALAIPLATDHELSSLRQLVTSAAHMRAITAAGVFEHNPTPVVNASVWTIRYELMCYLLVPALYLIGRRLKRAAIAVVFLLSLTLPFVASLRPDVHPLGAIEAWGRFLPCFLAGVMLREFPSLVPRRVIWVVIGTLLWIAGTLSHVRAVAYPMTALTGGITLAYFGSARWIPFSGIGRIGDFSYGVYLFAFPIQQLAVVLMGPGTSSLSLFAIVMPAILLVAAVSWHCVEKPSLRMKPRSVGADSRKCLRCDLASDAGGQADSLVGASMLPAEQSTLASQPT